jgi:two-component system, cell cycle sensor histidine kinase and response regulator CckA
MNQMSKHRILLVEDEKVVAADIEECIKGLGYEVAGSAASGAEALRLAKEAQPDLVLLDIKLKGDLDGIDVAGALHERLKIPVVYLTAFADAEILERARKTAPSGYVLKPFDDRSLRAAIEIAFDRHRRERELIEGEQRLATAVRSIDEAVIVTQEDGQVAVMNHLAETLTGWKQEDALGKSLGEVFTMLNAETGSLQPSPIGRVFREGISVGLGEHNLLLGKHGTSTPIQGSATPVRDGEDGAVGACLLFRAAGHRARDGNWGAPEHGSTSRLEILGRLTAAVAQKFSSLLDAGRGRHRAAQLANRLLAFGQRQPSLPVSVDLNELITGLEDLMRCALGDKIELHTVPASGTGMVKADPGLVELLLMQLAISARENQSGGRFSMETCAVESELSEDGYAMVRVKLEGSGHNPAADLPALDEIVRQGSGEIRIARESGAIHIYLPKVMQAA